MDHINSRPQPVTGLDFAERLLLKGGQLEAPSENTPR